MAVATYTKAGTKATSAAKLDTSVFGLQVQNHELLKQAYVAYLANGRGNNAQTLKRGEVSGGGRKPWKQKGTGRARFGSSRNPIWRGGGIAFGPTGNENYTHKLHVTAKRQALRQALSLSNEAGKVMVIEALDFTTAKTSEAAKLFDKLGVSRNVLVVVENKTDELKRATSNLNNIKLVAAPYINVYDVLNADAVILTNAALANVTERLSVAPKAGIL